MAKKQGKPTFQALLRELGTALGYVEVLAAAAQDARTRSLGSGRLDFGTASEQEINTALVFDRMVPTFLLVKLSTFLDESIEKLWQHRFPQIKPKAIRAEDRLTIVADVVGFNATTLTQLRQLRNKCAHDIDEEATWEDFEEHLNSLKRILSSILMRYKLKRALRATRTTYVETRKPQP